MARLKSTIRPRSQRWDRFAHWAPGAAMLVLALIAALLLGAALTARDTGTDAHLQQQAEAVGAAVQTDNSDAPEAIVPDEARDTDLSLYAVIAERVGAGESYYTAAIEEQRARNYPLRPGLAVRLPTLAVVTGWIGDWALLPLAIILLGGTLVAWHYHLRDVPGTTGQLRYILLLVVFGTATGLKPQYLVLHELWAGLFIALSLGLHRPGKWGWALLAAAAALSIRELALPFVMLMGALALLRGQRLEAAAWGALAVAFVAALMLHLTIVAGMTSASDAASPGWLTLIGLGGWTSKIVLTSPLYLLPAAIAAPLALLPLIGWAGWRSEFALTGFLLCLGYGIMFMITGRDNNFYWGLIIMPVWFVGLAYTPRALSSLWNSARSY